MRPCVPWSCQRVGALVGGVAVTTHRRWITRRLLGPRFTSWPMSGRGFLAAPRARSCSFPATMGSRWKRSTAWSAIVQAPGVDHTVESRLA